METMRRALHSSACRADCRGLIFALATIRGAGLGHDNPFLRRPRGQCPATTGALRAIIRDLTGVADLWNLVPRGGQAPNPSLWGGEGACSESRGNSGRRLTPSFRLVVTFRGRQRFSACRWLPWPRGRSLNSIGFGAHSSLPVFSSLA